MKELPKVLVFTVIYEGKDYCLDEFVKHAQQLTYPNYRHVFVDNSNTEDYYHKLKEKLEPLGIDVYHVERGNSSREALARSQNFARQIAIDEGYDYMLSLESDIMCPPETIQALMAWGRDVVTGLYLIGNENVQVPCITILKWNNSLGAYGSRLLDPEEFNDYLNKGLKPVAAGGFGVCLMSRHAFEPQAFYYDSRDGLMGHSDIYFFNDMHRRKIQTYVDTHCICRHENSNWDEVEDR